ncbi:spermidine synthase [Williamsia deligens]|uniref:Spermidine synthase n=1 Tax=Williamsia deligens TaxID=321325 RepID=A0ABW3GDA4_9NOCA|nr:fused MFS/spermidine synthase [Williamsia deligens]MCP2195774.1 spermidine synthase [Williamsia deligens]
MARRRQSRRAAPADARDDAVAGEFPIDTGTARITTDADGQGWLLEVNGVQSSHVAADPTRLDFEYMRWIAAVVADRHGEDRAGADPGMRVLHLGAAGCALPRHLAAVDPSSRHVAVEVDAALAQLVRDRFDIPRAPIVRIRVGDARAVTESLTPDSRDVVVVDVFAGATTPPHLTTVEFVDAVHRVLRPGGLAVMNIADTRDLRYARRQIATFAARFDELMLVADPAMLKGRRYGNVVLAASDEPMTASAALTRGLLVDAVPATTRDTAQTRDFLAGARPFTDADPAGDRPAPSITI